MTIRIAQDLTISYATSGSAGFDIPANESLVLFPMERKAVATGLFLEGMPEDMELQIRPRSGLAIKHGVTVLNAPGTIDSDYTAEIKVILINLGSEALTINRGDRIAQGVFSKVERPGIIPIAEKVRDGGFGSTGI